MSFNQFYDNEKIDWHNMKRSNSLVKFKEIYNDDKSLDLYYNVPQEYVFIRNRNDSFIGVPNSEKDNIGIGFWIHNTLCKPYSKKLISIILPNNIVIFVKRYKHELVDREPTEDDLRDKEYKFTVYDHEDDLRLLNNEFIDYIKKKYDYNDLNRPPKVLLN